jgi:hypothetical protein
MLYAWKYIKPYFISIQGQTFCIHLNLVAILGNILEVYECVSKSFRTGSLQQELQMVQFYDTRCSYSASLWVSLVSFAAVTLYVASQRATSKMSVYFVIDWVQKLLDTQSYNLIYVLTVSGFTTKPSAVHFPHYCAFSSVLFLNRRWLIHFNRNKFYCLAVLLIVSKVQLSFSHIKYDLLTPWCRIFEKLIVTQL